MDFDKQNIHVVLKFRAGQSGSSNEVLSNTMGRVAVINHSYDGTMPQASTKSKPSFWLCRVDREIQTRNGGGCFVVTPVRPVALEKISKLIPGTYDVKIEGMDVVCWPKIPEMFWILPFSLKKLFIKKEKIEKPYQSVIVPVQISDLNAQS